MMYITVYTVSSLAGSDGQRMENPQAVPDMDIVWKRFRSSW